LSACSLPSIALHNYSLLDLGPPQRGP
jgi:hypothetical protein